MNELLRRKELLKIINPKKKITHVSGKINFKNIRDLLNILENQIIDFLSLDIDSFDFYIMLEILKKKFCLRLFALNIIHLWARNL